MLHVSGLLREGQGSQRSAQNICFHRLSLDGSCKVCLVRVSLNFLAKGLLVFVSPASSWVTLFTCLPHRYVIECPNCGVVYRSRQYWFGNQDPVDTVVRTEIVHVWPGVRTTALIFCLLSIARSCVCALSVSVSVSVCLSLSLGMKARPCT